MPVSWYGHSSEQFLGGAFEPVHTQPKVPLRDKPTKSEFDPLQDKWVVSGPSLGRMAVEVSMLLGQSPTSSVSSDVVAGLEFVANLMEISEDDTEEHAEKRCSIQYVVARDINLLDKPTAFWNNRLILHEASQRMIETPIDEKIPQLNSKDVAVSHYEAIVSELQNQRMAVIQ